MCYIVQPKDWDLSAFALVEIKIDGSVRLLRTLNPDANMGLLGESYNEDWELDYKEATKRFTNEGFWGAWDSLARDVGGIKLTDDLRAKTMGGFMEMDTAPTVYCADSADAVAAIMTLEPGRYLFYVPMVSDNMPQSN